MYSQHYFLNAGAFDHEEEVLLYDGVSVKVLSVSDVIDKNGKKLYTLISLYKKKSSKQLEK